MFDVREFQLMSSVLNEALNGFTIRDFDVVIGMKRSDLDQLRTQLDKFSYDQIRLDQTQISALRNALRETLDELGVEFHTRTGFDLEDGELLLRKLNDLLAANKLS